MEVKKSRKSFEELAKEAVVRIMKENARKGGLKTKSIPGQLSKAGKKGAEVRWGKKGRKTKKKP